jgi:ribonucleoside-diphosphate reductase beta chain
MLESYAEWIGTKRMRAVGVESPYSPGGSTPVPWTEDWISGGAVQVAPQETEIEEYIDGGGIESDTLDSLSGFRL